MNAPSVDIKDLIESDTSLGLIYETNLFIGFLPDDSFTPNLCVGIYDSPGEAPEAGFTEDYPGIMIEIRGNKKEYNEAWVLAKNILDFVRGEANHNTTINGTKYVGIWGESDPIFVEWDENSRPMFTINFRITRG